MSDLITFDKSELPAHLQNKTLNNNLFSAAITVGGFPVISLKGKVFHVQRGDERDLITKPGDDEPVSSLEVIMLAVNPNKSKVYYDKGYEEGSVAKPTCYSNDSEAPALDAEVPQSKKCALCPHNQWGSRITMSGGKGKACGDSMRLAVASVSQINDPMLLRVPAATLKSLGSYGLQLSKRGIEPRYVVTKISFDHNVAYPALTFKALRFVEEMELTEVEETLKSEAELIEQITGVAATPTTTVEAIADIATTEEKAEPKKTEAKKAAPKKPKATPKEPKASKVEDFDDIDEALDNLNFDD